MAQEESGNITHIHQGRLDPLRRVFRHQQTGPSVEINRVCPPSDLPENINLGLLRRRPTPVEAKQILTSLIPPPPDGAA